MRNTDETLTGQAVNRNPQSAFRIRLDQPHPLLDVAHRLACERATPVRTSGKHVADSAWIRSQLTSPLVDGRELSLDSLEQNLLAVDASPARGRTHLRDVLHRLRRTERLVQMKDVAHFRRARIRPSHALGIGDRGSKLLPHRVEGF